MTREPFETIIYINGVELEYEESRKYNTFYMYIGGTDKTYTETELYNLFIADEPLTAENLNPYDFSIYDNGNRMTMELQNVVNPDHMINILKHIQSVALANNIGKAEEHNDLFKLIIEFTYRYQTSIYEARAKELERIRWESIPNED